MGQVVLVTGVSRYLGGRFARLLTEHPGIDRVIGVDVVPPPHSIGDAEFVRADIRNPIIAKVIAQAGVDTVAHLNVIATPTSAGGRVSMKEINVIGTMQLLAACQKAPSVQRLVVKSSAAVYGSSPRDPAMFTEDMGPKSLPRAGFGKDSVEVEGYVRGFSRRRGRRRGVACCGSRTSSARHLHHDDRLLLAARGADGARLRRPAAVRARGRRARGPRGRHGAPAGRRAGQRRRRRRGHRLPGRAARRPGRPCRCRCRPAAGSARSSGARGSPTSRPSRCSSSPTVAGWTPAGCARCSVSSRAYTTLEAFKAFVAAQRGPTPVLVPRLIGATRTAQDWMDRQVAGA